MEQPSGFVTQVEYWKVCHLKKSLYGLKQSPRAWFGKFSDVVQEFGLKKSKCDYLVFFIDNQLLVLFFKLSMLKYCYYTRWLCMYFFSQENFTCQVSYQRLGQLKYFLGVEVTRSKKGIFSSQRKYVLDLLTETGKLGAKPCNIPVVPSVYRFKVSWETKISHSNPPRNCLCCQYCKSIHVCTDNQTLESLGAKLMLIQRSSYSWHIV